MRDRSKMTPIGLIAICLAIVASCSFCYYLGVTKADKNSTTKPRQSQEVEQVVTAPVQPQNQLYIATPTEQHFKVFYVVPNSKNAEKELNDWAKGQKDLCLNQVIQTRQNDSGSMITIIYSFEKP